MATPPKCCTTGFQWAGTPVGHESTLAGTSTYMTGTNPGVGVLLVHDLFGWKFPNLRLLADHYAKEIGATVYLPDFFGGTTLDYDLLFQERFAELDVAGLMAHSNRDAREDLLFACAREMRGKHARVGAVGFCYGGWACLRLGAGSSTMPDGKPLVDAIAFGHPSLTRTSDFDENRAPTLVLAPEFDKAYTKELKQLTFDVFQANDLYFSYLHFPKQTHSFCVRGSTEVKGERIAMVRAKNAVVAWFRELLAEVDE